MGLLILQSVDGDGIYDFLAYAFDFDGRRAAEGIGGVELDGGEMAFVFAAYADPAVAGGGAAGVEGEGGEVGAGVGGGVEVVDFFAGGVVEGGG